jgi:hypothetical protein
MYVLKSYVTCRVRMEEKKMVLAILGDVEAVVEQCRLVRVGRRTRGDFIVG